jgi:branched-chain amino acid transport system substrate-binding protein
VNTIKQAAEFGIVRGGQNLAGLLVFLTDVHALGLKTAQGLIFTEAWYWDANDANRAFAARFAAANKGIHPTMIHAGVYSAVTHYLKALEAQKSDADGKAVVERMKATPTDDRLFGKGSIRADGRKIHDMYLFEVKKPEDSKKPWDYYKVRATIPAAEAFRPIDKGNCPLVKKG